MVRPFRARGVHSSMHSCAQLCLCHAVPEWLVPIGIKMCGRSRGWGQLSNDLCQGAIHAESWFSWFSWFIGISKFYEKSSNVCLVIWGSDFEVHIKSLCRDGQCAGLRGWTDLTRLWLQIFRQTIGILRHEFQLATDFLIIFQNKSFVGICRSNGKISHGVTSGSKRVGQVCFEMCPSKRSVDGKKRDGIKCIKRISKCISNHFFTPQKFNMEPENKGFQQKSPLPGADFQVNHVKLQGLYPCFLANMLSNRLETHHSQMIRQGNATSPSRASKDWSSRGPSQVHIRRSWASGVGTGATNWKHVTGWYSDIATCSNLSNMGKNTPGQVNDFDISSRLSPHRTNNMAQLRGSNALMRWAVAPTLKFFRLTSLRCDMCLGSRSLCVTRWDPLNRCCYHLRLDMDDPLGLGGYGDGIRRRGAETECHRDTLNINLTSLWVSPLGPGQKRPPPKAWTPFLKRFSFYRQQINILVEVPVSILCGFLGTSASTLTLRTSFGLGLVDIGTSFRCGENHHGAAHLEEQRRAQGLTFWDDIIVDWSRCGLLYVSY